MTDYSKEVNQALDELFSLNDIPSTANDAIAIMIWHDRFADLPIDQVEFFTQFRPRFAECTKLHNS